MEPVQQHRAQPAQQPAPAFPPARRHYPPSLAVGDVPIAFWVGLAVGLLGFVVRVDSISISTIDGYRCSYQDYGAWLVVAGVACCLVAGWRGRAQRHPARRLATPVMIGISVVLIAVAGYFALRGLGTVHNRCATHPLP